MMAPASLHRLTTEVKRSVVVCLSQLFPPGRKTLEFILNTCKARPQALYQRGNVFQHKVEGVDIAYDMAKAQCIRRAWCPFEATRPADAIGVCSRHLHLTQEIAMPCWPTGHTAIYRAGNVVQDMLQAAIEIVQVESRGVE